MAKKSSIKEINQVSSLAEYSLPSEIKRVRLTKSEAQTDPSHGCRPEERPIREYIEKGVININKPVGPTSHEVAAWIKHILDVNTVGHAGSLDPKVTGLLPTLIGKATKAVPALRLSGKEYVCLLKLHKKIPEKEIRRICKEFTGKIYQLPPVRSAVKRARRIRTIYYIEVIEIDGSHALIRVGCEAGTYIRKLCYDIGLALGCGGNMQQLHRTKTGPFRTNSAVTLHDLIDAHTFYEESGDESYLRSIIMPMEHALAHLPKIVIRDTAVGAVCNGALLSVPGVVEVDSGIKDGDEIAIFSLKGEAVSLAIAMMDTEEIMEAKSGIVASSKRILMDSGTYPAIWKKKL